MYVYTLGYMKVYAQRKVDFCSSRLLFCFLFLFILLYLYETHAFKHMLRLTCMQTVFRDIFYILLCKPLLITFLSLLYLYICTYIIFCSPPKAYANYLIYANQCFHVLSLRWNFTFRMFCYSINLFVIYCFCVCVSKKM